MLPVANVHLRNLYDSAVELLSAYSPLSPVGKPNPHGSSPSSPAFHTPLSSRPTSPLPVLSPTSSLPLSERLHAACLSPTSSLASLPPASMRRELDSTKHELARASADAAKLHERCRMLEKTLADTRDLLRARDAEIDKVRREQERDRAIADRERRRSDVGPQYQPHRDSLRPPTDQLHSRHSSLDIRTSAQMINNGAQLNGVYPRSSSTAPPPAPPPVPKFPITNSEEDLARTRAAELYLTRTDGWSGAQILQAVHDINSEILQFAASATEICTFSRTPSAASTSKSIQAMHDTSARIGQGLARVIANRDHSQDPILVQLALQSCVALCVARALGAFCIGFPSKSDAVLAQIYAHMQHVEPQPTSAKWRALTHAHIHALYPSLTDYSTNELSDTIVRWSADVFLIAGCHSPSPSSQSYHDQSDPSTRDGLRSRFSPQIQLIAQRTLRLARVLREDIMSASFEVVVGDPALPFDRAGMVDAFGEYGPTRGAVLGTTEVGVKCLKRVGGEQGAEGQQGEVRIEQRMLLKPKVVLESVLDVLDPR